MSISKVSIFKRGINMKIGPLNDRVIVKRVEKEQKTAGLSSSPTSPRKSLSREK